MTEIHACWETSPSRMCDICRLPRSCGTVAGFASLLKEGCDEKPTVSLAGNPQEFGGLV